MSTINQADVHKVNEWLKADSANILDIRDPMSFAMGHIPTATNLNEETTEEYFNTLDKEKTLVVCCYHGISSQGAAAQFMQMGFKDVHSMIGGFEAWQQTYPFDR